MGSALLMLAVGIVVVLAIIAVNGYFVAQEFAYMSVDRARLAARAETGDPAAKRALAVTRRTSFMLSGAQLGITVTGLLVGYVAEPMIGQSLGQLLGGLDIPAAVTVAVTTVGVLLAATIVQMIFGELYPKNLAIAAPEPLALALARSTQIYLAVFGWLIAIFDVAANLFLKLLRVEPVHDVDSSVSADELRRVIDESRQTGDLPEDLSLLIDRVIEFPNADVEHAMIPGSRVATVGQDATLGQLRELMAHAHSRYPVLDETAAPVGVVELVDLLRTSQPMSAPVTTIMRSPVVVPTLMALPDALEEMSRGDSQLACVIDEYGDLAGILTTEDVAEELVGEITDEHDDDRPTEMVEEAPLTWLADGGMPLDEVRRIVGFDLPEGDFETLAGLVIATIGGFAEVGDRIAVPVLAEASDLLADDPVRRELDVEVLTVDRHVPGEMRVTLVETVDGDDADDEGSAS
ncbi:MULTISPECIES: hemolysin family protein [Brevibacterium]|uniref:Hemolysin family protein n=1 Tax=Brevibacterium ammoniilyticum TaxID=1046555 RepID=A0ABP9U732_9MICO